MLFKLTTRSALPENAPFILEGYRDICSVSDTTPQETYTIEKIQRDLFAAPPQAHVVIALHQNEPVGFALFSTVYFAGEGAVMWISQVYVRPSHRGRNVVHVLMKALRETAREKRYGGICGATGAGNDRMQRLLKKAGARRLDGFILYSFPLKKD